MTPSTLKSIQANDLHIKATESAQKIATALAEIELMMRQSEPNKLQLAVIRANCLDINKLVLDIELWAARKYRKEL